jgi:hypothetical protein
MRLPAFVALAACSTLLGSPFACFSPSYSCRILCDSHGGCPPGLTCLSATNLCALSPDTVCDVDAGSELDAGSETGRSPMGPPPDKLCYGAACFTLSQAARDDLVLWLEPSSLPAPGSKVTEWPDRSGQGNLARAVNPQALPTAAANGALLVSEAFAGGFDVAHHQSLSFGTRDFLVLVAATVSMTTVPTRFFMKADPTRALQAQVVLGLEVSAGGSRVLKGLINDTMVSATADLSQARIRLFGWRRVGGRAEVRLNGGVVATGDVAQPGASTDNEANVFVGMLGPFGSSVEGLHTVIVVRAALEDIEVANLETFLMGVLAIGP